MIKNQTIISQNHCSDEERSLTLDQSFSLSSSRIEQHKKKEL